MNLILRSLRKSSTQSVQILTGSTNNSNPYKIQKHLNTTKNQINKLSKTPSSSQNMMRSRESTVRREMILKVKMKVSKAILIGGSTLIK